MSAKPWNAYVQFLYLFFPIAEAALLAWRTVVNSLFEYSTFVQV